MPVLTDKQRDQLNEAVKEYLIVHKFENAAAAFEGELEGRNARSFSSADTALEKKWTTNLRLQSKVLDLEKQIKQLQTDLSEVHNPDPTKKSKTRDALPVEPAKFSLAGHRAAVHAMAFHPQYSVLVTCGEDATTRVWDYETGEQERTLRGHTNQITCVDFDDSGKMLATCSQDMTVKLWDFQSGECLKTLQGHQHTVSCVSWFPGADALASCSRDNSVRLWDTTLGTCKRELRGHSDWVRVVIVSADGRYIASGGHDQSVRVWDGHTYKCIHHMPEFTNAVECLAFSNPEANDTVREHYKVADPFSKGGGGGGGGTTTTTEGGEGNTTDNHTAEKDDKPKRDINAMIAAAKARVAAKKEAQEGKKQEKVTNTPQFLVAGARDKSIKMWDLLTGASVFVLTGHDDWVRGITFHCSGKWILSVSDDRSIRMWDIAEGRCRRKIEDAHGHFVSCLAAHPTAKPIFATGSVDKSVKIWLCK
eukprot:TRINITY_DN74808_c0_g1_i1.p1 TRINITY_DN74808_c0_g1~~TRINITY_DN74808_c0_g1_i1.p1  ORF type:complete len:478 (-),score=19.66 TRINITY_DN74808_c0_g1_i1:1049-2482(-)